MYSYKHIKKWGELSEGSPLGYQVYLGVPYHVMGHAAKVNDTWRQVMRLLIQHGADVNLRDSMGYSAADVIFNRPGQDSPFAERWSSRNLIGHDRTPAEYSVCFPLESSKKQDRCILKLSPWKTKTKRGLLCHVLGNLGLRLEQISLQTLVSIPNPGILSWWLAITVTTQMNAWWDLKGNELICHRKDAWKSHQPDTKH